MKRSLLLFLVLLIMSSLSAAVQATTKEQELRGEVELKKEKVIYLFHSGTKDVRNAFCVGDIVPVYREVYAYGATKKTEVGKIKVISFTGDHYLKAEIVEGKIKRGDIAQKEAATCLVHPAPDEE